MNGKRSFFLITTTCLGIAFLYIPLILLVFYSFNKSRIVPVWGGFSTKWYGVLFDSEEVWQAVSLSLKIATVNATFAMILGTLAGLALVRFGSFKGRMLFSGMISAPLVMPEVITGLSLLLLFITLKEFIGWPDERGFTTITIAHITFSMAYVAVIIQSRLVGMAQDLEEAAQGVLPAGDGRQERALFEAQEQGDGDGGDLRGDLDAALVEAAVVVEHVSPDAFAGFRVEGRPGQAGAGAP